MTTTLTDDEDGGAVPPQHTPPDVALAVQLARLEGQINGALSTFTATSQEQNRRLSDEARRNDRQDEAIVRLRTERAQDAERIAQLTADLQTRAGRLAPNLSLVLAAVALLLALAKDLYGS